MTKVTYEPTDPSDEITKTFGHVFKAGKTIDITNEAVVAKLRGNPEFRVAGNSSQAEPDNSKEAQRVQKIVDGRSKEAREARQKAQEANQDAAAKERAAAQAQAIADAKAEAEAEKEGA